MEDSGWKLCDYRGRGYYISWLCFGPQGGKEVRQGDTNCDGFCISPPLAFSQGGQVVQIKGATRYHGRVAIVSPPGGWENVWSTGMSQFSAGVFVASMKNISR